jgi:magnesium chelatase family protein
MEAEKKKPEPGGLGDHVIILGPPGAHKTVWARAQRETIPQAERWRCEAASEYVYRVAGLGEQWNAQRPAYDVGRPPPFRAPHHSVSNLGLTGKWQDGWRLRPGEFSLAHGGVLFIDEAAELRRDTLSLIALVAKRGSVRLNRTGEYPAEWVDLPAEFRLVVAGTACPCGYRGSERLECKCTDERAAKHVERLRPLLDVCRVVPAEVWRPEADKLAREARGV